MNIQKKHALAFAAAVVAAILLALTVSVAPAYADDAISTQSDEGVAVHRLYNDVTSEHLFTTDRSEAANLANNYERYNWKYEGVGWVAPSSGTPVHRLYNPYLGHHLYTSDSNEIAYLCPAWGWQDEGVFFYSSGTVSIYRLYNPFLHGLHLITTSAEEYNSLPAHQWNQEGHMFNGLYKSDSPQATSKALRWVSEIVTVVDQPELVGYPQLGINYYFPQTGKTFFVPSVDGRDAEHQVWEYYDGTHGEYIVTAVMGDPAVEPAITHQEDRSHYE